MGNKEIWTDRYGPINENYRGDFIGFTWDGMSMSRLNIIRMSGGDRFNENLLATTQDKTTQVPGNDGTYYFGSWYTAKPFSIQIAFEKMTELQIRQLKQLFGDKKIHRLSFDEQPYKEYLVKCTETPQLKYIPFDDETEDTEVEIEDIYSPGSAGQWKSRIYKGEGILTFTAYYPYARARAIDMQTLRSLDEDVYLDTETQWQEASGLPETADRIYHNDGFHLYNPGDIETDFKIISKGLKWDKTIIGNIALYDKEGQVFSSRPTKLNAYCGPAKGENVNSIDTGLIINSKSELIEGINDNGEKTGFLYNDLIISGGFFKIPPATDKESTYRLVASGPTCDEFSIEYTYWYY